MITQIHSNYISSISEFKKSPMDAMKIADGQAIAVLNRNEPAFYCVPTAMYEEMLDLIEDLQLAQIAQDRKDETAIRVNIDEL